MRWRGPGPYFKGGSFTALFVKVRKRAASVDNVKRRRGISSRLIFTKPWSLESQSG